MSFSYRELLPDVFQIEDALGVCMTLLVGKEQALLVDAGFGLEDPTAFIGTLTDRPVRLILTHGHYDHAMGAQWFPEAAVFPEDVPLAQEHRGTFWRQRMLDSAAEQGIQTDAEAFLAAPEPRWTKLEEGRVDLGGLSAQVIACPGHTPGSAVVYVPERELLLTGDDWNPVTWLFFPESLPVEAYRRNMEKLLDLPFRHVICPHRCELYERSMLESFVRGLTEEALQAAKPVDTGHEMGIHTMEAEPAPGQCLVFDVDKWRPLQGEP